MTMLFDPNDYADRVFLYVCFFSLVLTVSLKVLLMCETVLLLFRVNDSNYFGPSFLINYQFKNLGPRLEGKHHHPTIRFFGRNYCL